jgi:hypothetical protein
LLNAVVLPIRRASSAVSNTAKRLGVNVLAYVEQQHERCVTLELDDCVHWPFRP